MHRVGIAVHIAVAVLAGIASRAVAADPPLELTAHESTPRPTPGWVDMVDLGRHDPALKCYRAPAGVKVDVVAAESDVINPVGIRFTDDGRLLVTEWKPGGRVC